MGRGLVRAIIILGDMMCSKKTVYPRHTSLHVRWLSSLTPVTYRELLWIPCVAAFATRII